MNLLGISCDFHDSAAALVVDGAVVAAAEEERFSRRKHDDSFPTAAIDSCLAIGQLDAAEIDAVVVYEKPLRVLSRVLAARQSRGPLALPSFVRDFPVLLKRNVMVGYSVERYLRQRGVKRLPPVVYGEHHLSHASAAFFPSPFATAAILTVDGVGEFSTATIGQGLRHRVEQLVEQRYPHSIGLLYSLATVWCGFEPNDGEYKTMGLAPYGEPRFADGLSTLATINEDGSLRVDPRRLRWWSGSPHRMRAAAEVFGGPPRRPQDPLGQREADIARSIQDLVETSLLRMAQHAYDLTGESSLCLGGGVALNCVANGRLLREGSFDEVWVQPAAGDAGSAIGAALWYWHGELGRARHRDASVAADAMSGCRLGPAFSPVEVSEWLAAQGVEHERVLDSAERSARVAARLAAGDIVGWFEGRMEFGPRALGHRSILADPRSPSVHRNLNQRVKGRESFRPFAPAVLWEEAASWFDIERPSRFMSFTFPVASRRLVDVAAEPTDIADRAKVVRSEIPACTHIDGSARVQTVHADGDAPFHELISAFFDLTGCPVLLNTSFNVAGEPIVCTPADALASGRKAGLDLLVIEDVLIELGSARAVGSVVERSSEAKP